MTPVEARRKYHREYARRTYVPLHKLTPEEQTARREKRRKYVARLKAEDPEKYACQQAARVAKFKSREGHAERSRKYQAAYRRRQKQTPEGWALLRWRELQKKCIDGGIPFNIRPEDILPLGDCPVLGTPFTLGGRRDDTAPSVDRVIPAKGYVVGNVRVISWLSNRIKNNCTDPDVFRKIAGYLERNSDR